MCVCAKNGTTSPLLLPLLLLQIMLQLLLPQMLLLPLQPLPLQLLSLNATSQDACFCLLHPVPLLLLMPLLQLPGCLKRKAGD
jgi:hypothetical protein